MPDTPTAFVLGTQVEDVDGLAQLIVTGGPLGRLGVATNPRCPPDLLRLLARDEVATVRLCALLHSNCPASTLANHLDELPALLAEVTALPNLDPTTVTQLQRSVAAIVGDHG